MVHENARFLLSHLYMIHYSVSDTYAVCLLSVFSLDSTATPFATTQDNTTEQHQSSNVGSVAFKMYFNCKIQLFTF